MTVRKAWVITWLGFATHVGAPIGAPLALLPGRASQARVEGALVALHQVLRGSAPSDAIGGLGRSPAYEVEWDYLRVNARIGHDPQVFAHHAEVRHSTRRRDPRTGEGELSYTHAKWTTRIELREIANGLIDAGQVDASAAFGAAEAALRARVATWPARVGRT